MDLEALGGVHLACGLLKSWFRELAEPVLGNQHYHLVFDLPEQERLVYIQSRLLTVMHPKMIPILKELFYTLNLVHQHEQVNLMPSTNLSLMFCPNFIASDDPLVDLQLCANKTGGLAKVVQLCIEEYKVLFP